MVLIIICILLLAIVLLLLFQHAGVFQNYTTQQAPKAQVIKHKTLGQHKVEEKRELKKKKL